ncbi:TPA: hypothetical protein N0F65_003694 [Lagenidium giganteum]|uniref:Uncharacterized protein n=1 Tax=Lagenidium giganteum TaxID=4803 RepID=A0AAV2YTK1_9STRA|nr:TPA: hypothetical protein N0F65_003694 [Lagenidium giganteum]
MDATAPLQLVEMHRFCAYLELRVQTKSIRLLQVLADEFTQEQEAQLLEFVRLGANLIAVLPLDSTSSRDRTDASTLLHERELQCEADCAVTLEEMTRGAAFLDALDRRLSTRNVYLLKIFFKEFMLGEDDELDRFIRCGCDVVSILPELRHDCQPVTASPPPSSPVQSPPHGPPVRRQQEGFMSPRKTEEPSMLTTRSVIVERVRLLEVCEPWVQIFDPNRLCMPFDGDRFPAVGRNWRRFWQRHSRAVWERHFWAPNASEDCAAEMQARHLRQCLARGAFERGIIRPLGRALGAEFFVALDNRPTPHEGWWYRRPRIDLRVLHRECGEEACWQYLQSQMYARFPVPPTLDPRTVQAKTERFFTSISASMWSVNEEFRTLAEDIAALKKHEARDVIDVDMDDQELM